MPWFDLFPSVTDDDAIHDNVAGEINAITEKATPVDGDWMLIEDSADSNNKKKAQLGNLPSSGGASSPLTTKGDVWGFSTVDARIPVGSDDQVLTADSAQTLGVKWATPSGGGGGSTVAVGGSATAINIATGIGPWATVASSTIPTVAAGNKIEFELWGDVWNNSGANRQYAFRWVLGAMDEQSGTTGNVNSGAQPHWVHLKSSIFVVSTSLVFTQAAFRITTFTTEGSLQNLLLDQLYYESDTSDVTGSSKSFSFSIQGLSSTATQELRNYHWSLAIR